MLQMARYEDIYLDSQFENGSDGNLYEYELIYYPLTADANGYKLPYDQEPVSVPGATLGQNVGDHGTDEEHYRWFFLTKNNRAEDNFDRIIEYNQHFGKSGAAFELGLDELVDVLQIDFEQAVLLLPFGQDRLRG